jgi:hypothetical protein
VVWEHNRLETQKAISDPPIDAGVAPNMCKIQLVCRHGKPTCFDHFDRLLMLGMGTMYESVSSTQDLLYGRIERSKMLTGKI